MNWLDLPVLQGDRRKFPGGFSWLGGELVQWRHFRLDCGRYSSALRTIYSDAEPIEIREIQCEQD